MGLVFLYPEQLWSATTRAQQVVVRGCHPEPSQLTQTRNLAVGRRARYLIQGLGVPDPVTQVQDSLRREIPFLDGHFGSSECWWRSFPCSARSAPAWHIWMPALALLER